MNNYGQCFLPVASDVIGSLSPRANSIDNTGAAVPVTTSGSCAVTPPVKSKRKLEVTLFEKTQ